MITAPRKVSIKSEIYNKWLKPEIEATFFYESEEYLTAGPAKVAYSQWWMVIPERLINKAQGATDQFFKKVEGAC